MQINVKQWHITIRAFWFFFFLHTALIWSLFCFWFFVGLVVLILSFFCTQILLLCYYHVTWQYWFLFSNYLLIIFFFAFVKFQVYFISHKLLVPCILYPYCLYYICSILFSGGSKCISSWWWVIQMRRVMLINIHKCSQVIKGGCMPPYTLWKELCTVVLLFNSFINLPILINIAYHKLLISFG